jgi:hypothetical protein
MTGVGELRNLKELQTLKLTHTKVSDRVVKELKAMESLQILDIRYTKVTREGLEQLKKALPNCQIADSF